MTCEQEARLNLIKRQVTDFIDNQQLGLHQRVELPVERVGIDGFGQSISEVHRRGKVNAVPHFGDQHSQRDGQVSLAGARWSRERRSSDLRPGIDRWRVRR